MTDAPPPVSPSPRLPVSHSFHYLGRERRLFKPPAFSAPHHPWRIRFNDKLGDTTILLVHHLENDGDIPGALKRARQHIDQRRAAGDPYTTWLASQRQRQTLTLATLAQQWAAAAYARPTEPRNPRQQRNQATVLRTALKWWGTHAAAAITPVQIANYADVRRLANPAGTNTGRTAADRELAVLSNLCAWARARGHLPANPFADRRGIRFQPEHQVRHRHADMPATDDELHSICGWLMARDRWTVAGAWIMFQALTGLRPSEPGALLAHARRTADDKPQPGHRWTATLDGQPHHLMAIRREKGGINPVLRVHPALDDFLRTWTAHHAIHFPTSPWLFPHPEHPEHPLIKFPEPTDHARPAGTKPIARALDAACAALGLPKRMPHALRAYYVRVRRSQNIDDARIAYELGQGSGPRLIVTTYGRRDDIADGRLDFLPTPPAQPAWTVLTPPANVIPLAASA